jgi:beta-D-xylosidase 4
LTSSLRCLFPFIGKSIDIENATGCYINGTDDSGFAAAIELARTADVVFFFGGLNQSIETEGRDRIFIDLPPIQFSLLQQLEKVVRSPIHVVIMSGSSLDLSYIRDSNNFASLIWAGYPGQAGGLAVANVIFGQYNPGGRLPLTFYPASYADEVSMFDMQMRPSPTNPGRTYKFYTGQAVYEFGYGLSYTTFSYSWSNNSLISSHSIRGLTKHASDDKRHVLAQSFWVNVTNTGSMAGDDVVLAFITPPKGLVGDPSPPIKQLFGFERVHLNVNATAQIYFPLHVSALATVRSDGSKWLEPGLYQIRIGDKLMHTIELKGKATLWSRLGE